MEVSYDHDKNLKDTLRCSKCQITRRKTDFRRVSQQTGRKQKESFAKVEAGLQSTPEYEDGPQNAKLSC